MERFNGPLRVRHHAEHVAPLVANSSDVPQTAIRVFFGITEDDLVVRLELVKGLLVGLVATVCVSNWQGNPFVLLVLAGKEGPVGNHLQRYRLADKLLAIIALQAARQQSRLS